MDKAIELIKKYEGLRLSPYLCPAGIPTIGYGSTRYEDDTPVSMSDKDISRDRANLLLEREVDIIKGKILGKGIHLTEGQLGALISFSYNLGVYTLFKSTLWRLLSEGKSLEASNQFKKWVHAGGVVLPGLVARREEERQLFLS